VPRTDIGKKIDFSINDIGKTRYPHIEDGNYILISHPVQNEFKMDQVRCEILKPPQENTGKMLEDTGIGIGFLNRTPI
jgi:hypothetical protein